MNRTKEQWAAARGIPQAAICDEAQQDIAELHARIEGLEAEIAAQTEHADFAWRNTNTIDKSHQELMAERDALMEKHNALHISARKDRDERDALRAQVEELKTVPMKYRRMEFNAQLQKENAELSAQVEELKSAFHNASAGFELAYVAIEQGRYDEALMHCGAHQARMLKTLQEQPK